MRMPSVRLLYAVELPRAVGQGAHEVPDLAGLRGFLTAGILAHHHVEEDLGALHGTVVRHAHELGVHHEQLGARGVGILRILAFELLHDGRGCELGDVVQVAPVPRFLQAGVGHLRAAQKFVGVESVRHGGGAETHHAVTLVAVAAASGLAAHPVPRGAVGRGALHRGLVIGVPGAVAAVLARVGAFRLLLPAGCGHAAEEFEAEPDEGAEEDDVEESDAAAGARAASAEQ